ncbi:MAG: TolC family protein [Terriglobales bacterium]
MRLRLPASWHLPHLLAFFVLMNFAPLSLVPCAWAEPMPLERAIRLALSHSTTTAISHADLQKAIASYHELRDNRIPQLTVGSNPGWSYGLPLAIVGSAPSLITLTTQSSVLNFAEDQYLGAAKADVRAADLQDKDKRNEVIEDVALSYAELAKWEARLVHLQQDESQAQQMTQAVTQRVQEGIDSEVDSSKAKLVLARVRLHRAEAHGAADVLRRHLSDLTGFPVSAIEVDPESMPPLPPVRSEDEFQEKAADSNAATKIADLHASAQALRASAEHRASLPSIDFAAQYTYLPNFNNYAEFYGHFQSNSVTIGAAIRFSIFNASQRAHAEAADFEALKAKKQAEATRDKVSEETLKLQRAAEQLEAARDVAKLEYDLAQSSLEAAHTRIEAKTATLHELADAQVQANERYLLFQDADFEYQRARLNLLRATGELEKWALPVFSPK